MSNTQKAIGFYNQDGTATIYGNTGGRGGGGGASTIRIVYDESPATKSHAVGTYIYFNNHVYKVTSAIIVGDTIAVGTNIAVDPDLLADDVAGIEGMPGGGSSKQQGYIIPASESTTVGVCSTTTVPLTIIGDGAISVTSSDSTKATGSISNNVLTITGVSSGIATLTITMADSATYIGTTATISVTSVPNGSTVTPTDDVQTWLHCAGIFDKNYTTTSQVLADSTTLATLIASQNAVDYLVRCKDWCGIALVPTMTSNTTPSGEVIYSTQLNASTYAAWKAFDSDSASRWATSNTDVIGSWIGYHFTSAVCVKKIYMKAWENANASPSTIKIQASNDGSTWTDLSNALTVTYGADNNFTINNNNSYSYYRVYTVTSSADPAADITIYELQFYSGTENLCGNQTFMSYVGLNNYASNTLLADSDWLTAICGSTYIESVLNVKVPTMTSNTTPSGEVSASGEQNYGLAYTAFDNKNDTGWQSQTEESGNTAWLQYMFESPINVKCVSLYTPVVSTYGDLVVDFQVGNDQSKLNTVQQLTYHIADQGSIKKYIITESNQNNKYMRLKSVQKNFSTRTCIYELQFYGREDV